MHHHRGRANLVWRITLEAVMPVRGRWLSYLGRGLFALGIVALPMTVALALAGLEMVAGVLLLVTAVVSRIEGCVLPESREFSGRMFRTAMWLFFGGAALVVIATFTNPLRMLVAPALYGRGF